MSYLLLASPSDDSDPLAVTYYTEAASALIHAFISSRIDFGNAIYSGLDSSLTLKL